MKSHSKAPSLFDRAIIRQAVWDSLRKLSPRMVAHNPVMFVVEVGSVLCTLTVVRDLLAKPAGAAPLWFTAWISVWLWITVVFANFAEGWPRVVARHRPIPCARCAPRPLRGAYVTKGARTPWPQPICAQGIGSWWRLVSSSPAMAR